MGKWAVDESVWPDETYQDFCYGWLWITTPKVNQDLDVNQIFQGHIDLVARTNEHLKVARVLAEIATVLPKAVPNELSTQGHCVRNILHMEAIL